MVVLLVSCGSDDEEKGKYNPNQASQISTFYPTEGKYQEKVMLTGVNLPTDPGQVKVYFNSRRAPVIGGTTERMYVMAPRLPGNADGYTAPGTGIGHCIISVVIGNDSLTYNDTFLYEESITVSTVAGNGDQENFAEGNLANAILQPKYIACDNDGNVFITNWRADDDRSNCYFCRLNEEENIFTRLRSTAGETNIPCVDLVTGVVTVSTEQTLGSYITSNPNEYWAPREKTMKFLNWTPPNGWKHAMVVNPTDGMVYTRWYEGSIVRIDPITNEAYRIAGSEQGDSYGLTFRPQEPNIMYISFRNNAGIFSNSIVTVDVSAGKDLEETDPDAAKAAVEATIQRVSSPSTGGGHRDGPLATAQFRNLGQIFCDQDGFIYVADRDNHCIRRITPENQVETALGVPGTPGWRDGTRDEALFRNPMGIAIAPDGSVYVADNGNSRLRKLSVN
jgi:streptogramin lyase